MSVKTILVIDDSAAMRKLVRRNLLKTKYAKAGVIEATDGSNAKSKFCPGQYDLVLCDWNMPVMDGLSFVKWARARDNRVTIIMVTTEVSMAKVRQAVSAGADGYVAKPFTGPKLEAKIDAALRLR